MTSTLKNRMSLKGLPLGLSLLTLAVGISVSLLMARLDGERQGSEQRRQVQSELVAVSTQLDNVIKATFSATDGLVNLVAIQQGIDAALFSEMARLGIAKNPHIRNIALAPNEVVRHVYPAAGNERVIGFNYRSSPEQYSTVERARETRLPVLAGPVNLVQGGRGLIYRAPVFLHVNEGSYWGVVSIVAHVDALLEAGGVSSNERVLIALRGKDGRGGDGELIAGETSIFKQEPVTAQVSIPGGKWQLAAIPRQGWTNTRLMQSPYFGFGLLATVVLTAITIIIALQRRSLQLSHSALEQEATERKKALDALRSSQGLLQTITEHFPGAISMFDDQLRLVASNGQFQTMLELPDEIMKRETVMFEDLIRHNAQRGEYGSDNLEEKVASIVDLAREFKPHTFERVRPNGRAIEVRGTPLPGGGFVSTYVDITERRMAEAALRKSEERLRHLVETTSDWVWEVDANGIYTYVSSKVLDILGYTPQEVLGKTPFDLMPADEAARVGARFAQLTAAREPLRNIENINCHKDGSLVVIETSGVPLFDSGGQYCGYRGMDRDITVRKKYETELIGHQARLEQKVQQRTAELAAARDAAEAANRAKSIFLATMSHEMRTPMNGVMGMIDLALRRATDPKQIDWLNKSKGSAKHLLDVIGDILDISHLEAEKMTLEETNFSLTQVIEDVLQMQGEAAQAKGLHLSPEISPALPDLLCGDPTRLRQILINFVGNAIKFSDHGQITVNAHAAEEDRLGVLLRIEVADQGIGISPEQQARLFRPFTQADGTMTRKYGGTGLGLSICKRIALLMGGDAGVISEEGQGSTFWVTVRLKKGTDVVEAPPAVNVDAEAEIRQRYAGQRILVVDDEPINREVALIQLEAVDLVIDTAEDGADAVALARKNSYSSILMDMQMPKLNGIEATRLIRQLPGYRNTPIIAMTANAFAEDKAQCLEAGMNDFLIKPFNPDELFGILLRSLDRQEG